jgi:hypothetical protein
MAQASPGTGFAADPLTFIVVPLAVMDVAPAARS